MIIYKDGPENLHYLMYRLHPEIQELHAKGEILADFYNNRIEMTQNAFEKIMYYLGQKEQEIDWYRKVKERMHNTKQEAGE